MQNSSFTWYDPDPNMKTEDLIRTKIVRIHKTYPNPYYKPKSNIRYKLFEFFLTNLKIAINTESYPEKKYVLFVHCNNFV
jgi:hypothetical protein